MVDWNDNAGHETNKEGMEDMSIESEIFEEEVNISISASSKPESEETEDDSWLELMALFKKRIFCLIFKINNSLGQDYEQFKKAIFAFIKQCDKLCDSNDAKIQKALFTFGKETVPSIKKRKRKMLAKYQFKVLPNPEDM